MYDHDTVAAAEETLERTFEGKMAPLRKAIDTTGRAVFTRVPNFTCPACTETLPEAVAVNRRVRGWCGNKHVLVNVTV